VSVPGATPHAPAARTGIVGWPRAALLSLSDKAGAAEFAALLAQGGTRILASGGTFVHLTQAGVPTTSVRYNGTLHDFMMLNPVRGTRATTAAVEQAIRVLRGALGTG